MGKCFMGWSDFREGHLKKFFMGMVRFQGGTNGKIGTKLEKRSISQSLKGNFYCLSLNGKNTPILPF